MNAKLAAVKPFGRPGTLAGARRAMVLVTLTLTLAVAGFAAAPVSAQRDDVVIRPVASATDIRLFINNRHPSSLRSAYFLAPPSGSGASSLLFSDDFTEPNGANDLITNEYSFWNRSDIFAVQSPRWEMTSGSLFSVGCLGWSGQPNNAAPDRYSRRATGSAIFRLRTRRADFADNVQAVDARINSFVAGTPDRPARDWDGVVLWPRYRTEFNLYFADILRKDGKIAITKKCPGGDPTGPGYSNAGTYYDLVRDTYFAPTRMGQWYRLATSVHDNPDGSVTVSIFRNGMLAAQATDRGIGCPPIVGPTQLGIRGDNADFNLASYRVSGHG